MSYKDLQAWWIQNTFANHPENTLVQWNGFTTMFCLSFELVWDVWATARSRFCKVKHLSACLTKQHLHFCVPLLYVLIFAFHFKPALHEYRWVHIIQYWLSSYKDVARTNHLEWHWAGANRSYSAFERYADIKFLLIQTDLCNLHGKLEQMPRDSQLQNAEIQSAVPVSCSCSNTSLLKNGNI